MGEEINKRVENIILKKLAKLNRFINLIELTEKDVFSNEDIKTYYRITKYLLYRVFGSRLGYMHMAVSEDNFKNDFNYHPRKIAELINKTAAKNVLELGSGQSANIIYLAPRFPNVTFTGIDLYPSISKRNKRDNIFIKEGDYHDLREIESDSLDIVYAVETLCYSTNKQRIYNEVYRVLKPGGVFVVWDAYLGVPRDRLTPKQLLVVDLVENGFCLDEFEYFGNIKNYEKKWQVLKSENMKKKLLPCATKNRERVDGYMKFGIFFKIFCYVFPKKFINNLAPIYLMEDIIKYDLSVYYELRYRK